MTIGYLRERLVYWQGVLKLSDWAISLKWGNHSEMDDAVGICYWSPEETVASIMLLRKQDDHEETLVHELLHLLLEGHTTMGSFSYSEMYERGINRIAAALVKLDKGK